MRSLREASLTMGRRSYRDVKQAFGPEAEKAFRFLVDERGFEPPERDDFMMPGFIYHSVAMRYEVILNTHEDRLSVTAVLVQGPTRTRAALEDLVTASGLGSGQNVFSSARTVRALLKALADQAEWVKRLDPILVAGGGRELIERAGQRWTGS